MWIKPAAYTNIGVSDRVLGITLKFKTGSRVLDTFKGFPNPILEETNPSKFGGISITIPG